MDIISGVFEHKGIRFLIRPFVDNKGNVRYYTGYILSRKVIINREESYQLNVDYTRIGECTFYANLNEQNNIVDEIFGEFQLERKPGEISIYGYDSNHVDIEKDCPQTMIDVLKDAINKFEVR